MSSYLPQENQTLAPSTDMSLLRPGFRPRELNLARGSALSRAEHALPRKRPILAVEESAEGRVTVGELCADAGSYFAYGFDDESPTRLSRCEAKSVNTDLITPQK